VSFGTRYQAQQHLNDYNNIAPTFGVNYQLNTKQNWQTVVRAGARMNYSTYGMGNWEQLLRNGVNYQTNYELLQPDFPNPDLSALNALATNTATTRRIRAENYTSGYTLVPSVSVDQQLPKGHRLSFNLQMSRGLHQTRNRNINAPFPGTPLSDDIVAMLNFRCGQPLPPAYAGSPCNTTLQNTIRADGRALVDGMRPDPTIGNISMAESSGKSLTKNFSIQYRVQNKRILGNKFTIGGNVSWNMNWAKDDSGSPVNNWDLASEWGRAGGDQRHRISGSLNIQAPWNLRFGFTGLGWNSGRPYNITLGTDLNGDGSNNDRPVGISRNAGTGPSTFNAISLNITKIIPLQGGSTQPRPANDYAEPEPQRGGGGFGGGGGGGGGGSRTGGRQIQLGVSISNLFNSTIRSNISGVMSSPLFGQVTGGGSGRTIRLSLNTNLGRLF
jgi:hypothetical protein